MIIVLPENCMRGGVRVEICPQKALKSKKNNLVLLKELQRGKGFLAACG